MNIELLKDNDEFCNYILDNYYSNNSNEKIYELYNNYKMKCNDFDIVEIKSNKIILNEEQQNIFDNIIKGDNCLLTAPAGCGKTTIIKFLVSYYKKNNINFEVSALTGSASVLINGRTIHSVLGIGLAKKNPEDLAHSVNFQIKMNLIKLQVLIIDEISMMDALLFEKISKYLSIIRNDDKLFGGIQVVFSGDFAQLSPINISNGYCFESELWKNSNIKIFQLSHSFRQKEDETFTKILNYLRFKPLKNKILSRLEKLFYTEFPDEIKPIHIYSTNKLVDKVNISSLYNLLDKDVKHFTYKIKNISSNTKLINSELKKSNIPNEIKLCIGLQVIINFNINVAEKIVNGTFGIIHDLNEKEIILRIPSLNKFYTITYILYSIEEKNEKNKFEEIKLFQYIPLSYGYAITVHKSQGKTLEYIEIDLGNCFAYGMGYTVLSRAKQLKNIRIINVNLNSFKCNPIVKEFYDNISK